MAWSTPIPKRKISTWLPVGTTGTLLTELHVLPSFEVLNTMSSAWQLVRNRQSDQATYTFPRPSTSAEARPVPSRMLVAPWAMIEAIVKGPV
ncbi:MAG: hypothetical protein E6G40_13415 [Actinobacteria bacterium]|nr:MAG: hypothetical protein E6G40_13415 [Actinomycetota bacterium]